jgi:hypothetical protein
MQTKDAIASRISVADCSADRHQTDELPRWRSSVATSQETAAFFNKTFAKRYRIDISIGDNESRMSLRFSPGPSQLSRASDCSAESTEALKDGNQPALCLMGGKSTTE